MWCFSSSAMSYFRRSPEFPHSNNFIQFAPGRVSFGAVTVIVTQQPVNSPAIRVDISTTDLVSLTLPVYKAMFAHMPKVDVWTPGKFEMAINQAARSATNFKHYTSVSSARLLVSAGRTLRLSVGHFEAARDAIINNSGLILAPILQQEQLSRRLRTSTSNSEYSCRVDRAYTSGSRFPHISDKLKPAVETCASLLFEQQLGGGVSRARPRPHQPVLRRRHSDPAGHSSRGSPCAQVWPEPATRILIPRDLHLHFWESATFRQPLRQRPHRLRQGVPREQLPARRTRRVVLIDEPPRCS